MRALFLLYDRKHYNALETLHLHTGDREKGMIIHALYTDYLLLDERYDGIKGVYMKERIQLMIVVGDWINSNKNKKKVKIKQHLVSGATHWTHLEVGVALRRN